MSRRFVTGFAVLLAIAAVAYVATRLRFGTDEEPGTEEAGVLEDRPHITTVTDAVSVAAAPLRAEPDLASVEIPTVPSHEIPESVRGALGMVGPASYHDRMRAVHSLPARLSRAEAAALVSFLNRGPEEDPLPVEALNAVKNDVLGLLIRQDPLPEDLAGYMMAMYADANHDDGWRDYCIQHLGLLLPRLSDPRERRAAEAMLERAAREKGTSLGGTSLIAMRNNIGEDGFGQGEVAGAALRTSLDPECGDHAKITALQVCAELGEMRALPAARELATSAKSVPLRMSAIAAVGTLGGDSDRGMLEELSRSSDTRLRTAAKSALGRLGKATWRKKTRK